MGEMTPWFPPEVKPVRVGVYAAGAPFFGEWFKYWNGKKWGLGDSTPALAFQHRRNHACSQAHEWRGLAKEPK